MAIEEDGPNGEILVAQKLFYCFGIECIPFLDLFLPEVFGNHVSQLR